MGGSRFARGLVLSGTFCTFRQYVSAQLKLDKTIGATVMMAVLSICTSEALALDFAYARIGDLNTPIPGGSGNFTSFFSPSIDGSNVAFRGLGNSDQSGIYADIGGLKVIADENTTIPDGTGDFTGFGPPSISGSHFSFQGVGSGQSGIYTDIDGLNVVADLNTPIPSGAANFTSFGTPSLDGSNVAFRGNGSGQAGIYTDIGGLNVVADLNTPIPGGSGNYTSFDTNSPLIDGGNVAFEGFGSSQNGIYTDIGGLGVVADLTTPIPGGSGNFTSFQSLSFDGGSVAFEGLGSGQNGIYTDIGGLGVVADLTTSIPGGSGNFTIFTSLSVSGGNVAFRGAGTGQDGIYIDAGGLDVVADLNTPIPDGSGNFTSFVSLSYDADAIAFTGLGGGGQEGIYVAFQEHKWESVTSGLWDDGGNWRFDTVPGQIVPTFINPENGLQITGPGGPVQVVSLTIGAQQSGVAELRLQPNGHLTIETALTVQSGGKLRVDGVVSAAGSVANMGEIELMQGAQLNGGILGNSGAVRGDGTVGSILQNFAGGEVRASAGQRLFFTGVDNTNAGDIEVIGGEVEFSGDLTNSVSTGLIAGENATFRFNGGLTSNGALAMSFGTSRVFGDVTNSSTGVIAVAGNSQATFYDDVANSGVLNVVTGSTAVFLGALTGNGNSGGGDVQALGDLVPGASPGLMNFSGDLTVGPLTNLIIELGGTSPGTYDRILVAGDLSLDGVLDVSILPGFTPSVGQSFNILDWGNLDGEFIDINLPTLDGLNWDTSQLYTTGALTLSANALPGDYNMDGTVDGDDFLLWQRDPSVGSLADWEANYGRGSPLGEAVAVPEPTSLLLAILGGLQVMCRVRFATHVTAAF